MTDYAACNQALNSALFGRRRYGGRQLFLQLSEKVASEVAGLLGVEREGLEEKICRASGKALGQQSDPYGPFHRKWAAWKQSGGPGQFPPTTALLFSLSHAATLMGNDGDFTGGNFYDRLGMAVGYPSMPLRLRGCDTERLWTGFNSWLEECAGVYGVPTAFPFNSWKYVNYAQSQAVVRAGDLSHFHSVFRDYKLSQRTDLGPMDLVPYIDIGLAAPGTPPRLKQAWRQKVLRKRFCEIIHGELEAWTAEHTDGWEAASAARKAMPPLSLAVTMAKELGTWSSRLFLGTGDLGKLDETGWPALLGEDGTRIDFRNDIFGAFARLVPEPLGTPERFLAGLSILSEDGSPVSLWEARTAIPLQAAPFKRGLWVESARFPEGEPACALVRCSHGSALRITDHFKSKGCDVLRIPVPRGVPGGWTLFAGLELSSDDLDVPPELAFALPLPETGLSIQCIGGMRLAARTWHTEAPPDMAVVSPDGPALFKLAQLTGPERETPLAKVKRGRTSIKGGYLTSLGEGRYLASAQPSDAATGMLAARYGFEMADASVPRPLGGNRFGGLAYAGGIFAALAENAHNTVPDAAGPVVKLAPLTGDANPCARSGHLWRCEPFERGMKKSKVLSQECMRCGRVEKPLFRGVKKSDRSGASVRQARRQPVSIDANLFFSALCYLGSGSLADVDRILSNFDVALFEGQRLLENLAALGHVLLKYRSGSASIEGWAVCAPSLDVLADGRLALRGFRNARLQAAVGNAARKCGGSAVLEDGGPGATDLLKVALPEGSGTMEPFLRIRDCHGRKLRLRADPAGDLLTSVCKATPFRRSVRALHLPHQALLQVFDLESNRWAERASSPLIEKGRAYRTRLPHARYCFVDSDGSAFASHPAVVKAFAYRAGGRRAGNYDGSARTYTCRSGLEPPGLLSASLCLPSGKLPSASELKSYTTQYDNVPEETGKRVAAAMNGGP